MNHKDLNVMIQRGINKNSPDIGISLPLVSSGGKGREGRGREGKCSFQQKVVDLPSLGKGEGGKGRWMGGSPGRGEGKLVFFPTESRRLTLALCRYYKKVLRYLPILPDNLFCPMLLSVGLLISAHS